MIGGYDEASIRYMGRNIPSKSFRMLQSMTGGPDAGMPEGETVRSCKPPRLTSHPLYTVIASDLRVNMNMSNSHVRIVNKSVYMSYRDRSERVHD